MTDIFRWQWMWRSRPRLIGIGLGAVALGGAVVLFAVLTPGPFNKGKGLAVAGGVVLAAMGSYQVLQGVFSPAGAFGDHDAPDRARRSTPARRRRRNTDRRTDP